MLMYGKKELEYQCSIWQYSHILDSTNVKILQFRTIENILNCSEILGIILRTQNEHAL